MDLFDVYFDDDEIGEMLQAGPRLCFLLNPDLSKRQVAAFCDALYVVDVERNGQTHFAVLAGCFKGELTEAARAGIQNFWIGAGEHTLFEAILTEPELCVLLGDRIAHSQLDLFTQALIVIGVDHEEQQRYACVAAYYEQPPLDEVPTEMVDFWVESEVEGGDERAE